MSILIEARVAEEGTLGTFRSGAETAEGTRVRRHVLLVPALEFLGKVADETVDEVLTAQISVASGGFNLEDSLLDRHEMLRVPPPRPKMRTLRSSMVLL